MAAWNHGLYLQVLSLMLAWTNDAEENDFEPRMEAIESCRETCRSVLSSCGLHRLTQPFAEAWIVFTAVKISIVNSDGLCVTEPPIASAAPASTCSGFHLLGHLPHASILEEEMAGALDWLDGMITYAEVQRQPEATAWFGELRFFMSTSLFALLHRHDE